MHKELIIIKDNKFADFRDRTLHVYTLNMIRIKVNHQFYFRKSTCGIREGLDSDDELHGRISVDTHSKSNNG